MTRWLRTAALCALCGVVLHGCGEAAEGNGGAVQVSSVAGVASSGTIPPKVKQECALQTDLPEAIAAYAADVKLVQEKPESGLYLELVVTHVHAPGGGIFTGPKWVEARGRLERGGKELRSFRARRISAGPSAGTCEMLARVTNAMGQDIAGWLADESAGSLLGDAR